MTELTLILIVNLILIIIYVLTIAIFQTKRIDGSRAIDVSRIIMNVVVMLCAPIIGFLVISLSSALHRLIFNDLPDLSDVVFSKDRVEVRLSADVDAERNFVPLEEALNVSDTESLRQLMLNVIKGDVTKSLASIARALNSEDSETSHYAASVLRDELNEFSEKVAKIYKQINDDEESDENRIEYIKLLVEYMNPVLVQKVFAPMEQKTYVDTMDEVLHTLKEYYPEEMKVDYIEWTAELLIDIGAYDRAYYWVGVISEMYPNELGTYTTRMRYFFYTGDRERFFAAIKELKASDIVIDQATLEQIRIFTGEQI